MNLSNNTVAILKNFAEINKNILVKPGKQLKTISTLKNILAEADIDNKFEQEFAIYDLPEFLRAVELFNKSDIQFNGTNKLVIKDANSRQSVKYFFADKSVIVAPTKSINMPDKYVTFTLKNKAFADLQKGIVTLNLPDIAVKGDGKTITMIATDKKNKSSNDYSAVVGETDKEFVAYFKAENLKIIPDDYVIDGLGIYNIFENTVAINFNHRWLSIFVFFYIIFLCLKFIKFDNKHLPSFLVYLILFFLILQVALGIVTLLSNVYLPVASLHQTNSILLLSTLLISYHQIKIRKVKNV